MSAKVTFSTDKRMLKIEDRLGVGGALLRLGYILVLALVTAGLMQTLPSNGWMQNVLGLSVAALVAYLMVSTILYRHKVWINSAYRSVRVQYRTQLLGVRTQEFSGSLFRGVRTREIQNNNSDIEFEVELVGKDPTQILKLATFNGKRMERSFWQLPVFPGEPDEAATLRKSVANHLNVKNLGSIDS